jgi:hypothetical protein
MSRRQLLPLTGGLGGPEQRVGLAVFDGEIVYERTS